MIKRRILISVIALAVVAVVASVVYADLTAGTKAPNFTLPTIDGKDFTLANSFKGTPKVVLLDIWATWCPPCRAEIPQLISLQKKFANKDVLIVGVAIDAEKTTVADFVKAQGINYTTVHDPNGDKIGSLYQVRGIPATYIIDKTGVIRYAHSGFPRDPAQAKAEGARFEREINSLLAKKK